jgi:serine/threonine protein kinase
MEMLHQDLRPENIMIDKEGTVKIIDFGAVSIAGLEETQSKTPATYLMGTALYSAPEYFLGEAGTAQSDLFSLGVITYYLLSGRYPYGTNMAKTKTLSAQKRLNYLSLLDEDREIPSWIDAAIRKAVHVLPYKRHEDIFELTHDLRQPNTAFLRKNKQPLIERNPVAFWKGVSIILFIIILVVGFQH